MPDDTRAEEVDAELSALSEWEILHRAAFADDEELDRLAAEWERRYAHVGE